MPAGWTAAAIAGSGAAAAGSSLLGSGKASSSAKDASNLQRQQYAQTRSDLLPYNTTGQNALTAAYDVANRGPTGGGPDYVGMAYKNLPGNMTQADLEATPGYQFTLNQGLKSTQSAAAARGLGVSGASLKGAAQYATGLADKTYLDQFNVRQQQFQDYLNLNTGQQGNITNQFNRLNAIATLGENAAAQTGTQGTALANQAGNYLNQAGLASAAGITGVSNALTGAANNYLAYNAYNQRTAAMNPTTGGYTPPNGYNTDGTPMNYG